MNWVLSKRHILPVIILMSLTGQASARDCINISLARGDTIAAIAANSDVVAMRTAETDEIRLVSPRSLKTVSTITLDAKAPKGFALLEGSLAAMAEDGGAVVFYDTATGEERERVALPKDLAGCGHALAAGDDWVAVSCLARDRVHGSPGRILLLQGGEIRELAPPPSLSGSSFGSSLAGLGNRLLIGSPGSFRAWQSGPPPASGAWLLDLASEAYEFYDGEMGATGFSGVSVALAKAFLASSTRSTQLGGRTTVHAGAGARIVLEVGGTLSASGAFLSVAEPQTPDGERAASVSLYRIESGGARELLRIPEATQAAVTSEFLFHVIHKGRSSSLCRTRLSD